MPESAKPKQQSEPKPKSAEAEQQDDSFDPEKAAERGWFGNRPETFDDAEFALTTGPNSPGERDVADPDSYDSSKSVTDE